MSAVHTYLDESFWVDPGLNNFVPFGSDDGHVFGFSPEQCHNLFAPCLPPAETDHAPPPAHGEQYTTDDIGNSWHHQFASAPTYGRSVLHRVSPHVASAHGNTANMTSSSSTPSPPIPDQSWTQSPPSAEASPQSDEVTDDLGAEHAAESAKSYGSKRGRRATPGQGPGTGPGPGPGKNKPAKKAADAQAKCHNALERNRLAATNFRKRTKESVHKLESVKEKLESKHRELQSEYSKLSYEVLQLKNDIMFHAGCQDDKIDIWIKREAQNYTQKLVSDRQQPSPSCMAGPFDGHFDDLSSVSPVTADGFTSLFPARPRRGTARCEVLGCLGLQKKATLHVTKK